MHRISATYTGAYFEKVENPWVHEDEYGAMVVRHPLGAQEATVALTGPSREIIVEPIEFPGPREIPDDPEPALQPEPVPVAPKETPANV